MTNQNDALAAFEEFDKSSRKSRPGKQPCMIAGCDGEASPDYVLKFKQDGKQHTVGVCWNAERHMEIRDASPEGARQHKVAMRVLTTIKRNRKA